MRIDSQKEQKRKLLHKTLYNYSGIVIFRPDLKGMICSILDIRDSEAITNEINRLKFEGFIEPNPTSEFITKKSKFPFSIYNQPKKIFMPNNNTKYLIKKEKLLRKLLAYTATPHSKSLDIFVFNRDGDSQLIGTSDITALDHQKVTRETAPPLDPHNPSSKII